MLGNHIDGGYAEFVAVPAKDVVPMPDDVPLVEDGWERRLIAVGARLDESVALYTQLGFEVRLELPTALDLREECGDCHAALRLYRIVYTRRPE
jgi:hypothetical protein